MKLFLVRHGQDEDNANGILNGRRDTILTQFGRQQAYTVAQKLKDCSIDVIYTSPLARSYQTAQIIANVIAVDEVIADQHLIERDFGILTGKPVDEILRYTDKIIISGKVNYFLDVEGAESFPALYNRAQKTLSEIQQRYRDNVVLIVTHGDIGKMIRGVYSGWSWERSLQTPYFDNTDVLELSNQSISR